MLNPKSNDIVWANVTDRLCRKVKIVDKRKRNGLNEYLGSYMIPNGGSRWLKRKQLIKYA